MQGTGLLLALGVFLGNWLIVPTIFNQRSRTDGFCIGLLAAGIIVLGIYIFKW